MVSLFPFCKVNKEPVGDDVLGQDSLGVHVEDVGGDRHHRGLQLANDQVDSTHLSGRHTALHSCYNYLHKRQTKNETPEIPYCLVTNLCVKRIQLQLVGAFECFCVHLQSQNRI